VLKRLHNSGVFEFLATIASRIVKRPRCGNPTAESFHTSHPLNPYHRGDSGGTGLRADDILVTHKPNIIDALGTEWFDVNEGEASIFKPEGGRFRLVARVQIEDWPSLMSAGR
jgi:hypothetical protein